jgi:hypothetical protein
MTNDLDDQPIDPRYQAEMKALACGLDELLNGPPVPGEPRTTGFVLMVFELTNHGGRCNYISNARREDIVVLLREQLGRFTGNPDTQGTT